MLGYSVSRICFEGPAERLMETDVCQPALVATSVAAFRVAAEAGLEPGLVMGHSLGEYSALVAGGALGLRRRRCAWWPSGAPRCSRPAGPRRGRWSRSSGSRTTTRGPSPTRPATCGRRTSTAPARWWCRAPSPASTGSSALAARALGAGDAAGGGRRLPLPPHGAGGRAPRARAGGVGPGGRPIRPSSPPRPGSSSRPSGCARISWPSSPSPVRFGDAVEAALALGGGALRGARARPRALGPGAPRPPRRAGGPGGRARGRRRPSRPWADAGRARHRRQPRDRGGLRARPRGGRLRRGRRIRLRRRRRGGDRRGGRGGRRRARRSTARTSRTRRQAGAMVEAVEEALGPLDAVVLNAGITRDGLAVRMGAEDWSAVHRHQPRRAPSTRPAPPCAGCCAGGRAASWRCRPSWGSSATRARPTTRPPRPG